MQAISHFIFRNDQGKGWSPEMLLSCIDQDMNKLNEHLKHLNDFKANLHCHIPESKRENAVKQFQSFNILLEEFKKKIKQYELLKEKFGFKESAEKYVQDTLASGGRPLFKEMEGIVKSLREILRLIDSNDKEFKGLYIPDHIRKMIDSL